VIALGRGEFDRGTQRVIGAGRQSHVKHYAGFDAVTSVTTGRG
jgi:hypothetical protein